MPRPTLPLLAALALSGCTHATSMPVNLVSRAEFAPAERDAVWSRVLTGLQATNFVNAAAEGDARFASIEIPKTQSKCRKWDCEVTGTLQVIETPSGVLSARFNRTYAGEVGQTPNASWDRLLVEEDVARLQAELDAWVAGLIGKPQAK